MAKKSAAAPRFYEVVFRGKPSVVKAFLKGLMIGADQEATAFFSYDEHIHHEGRAEKLKEMIGVRPIDCHVVLDAEFSAYLKKLARRITDETGIEITGNRYVRSARMEFEYHAYARKYSDRIAALLADLPQGLKLEGYRHEIHNDPSAKGVEAYSAAHDFESSGQGAVTGRIDLLVEFRRHLEDYPLIDADEIRLNLA